MRGRTPVGMFLSVLALISVLALADQAFAQDDWTKGFLIRARGIAVVPDESSTVTPIGGEVKIDNAVAPELDLSYFFTENLALEVIAATTKHDARASGTSLGNLDLGEFWILPP